MFFPSMLYTFLHNFFDLTPGNMLPAKCCPNIVALNAALRYISKIGIKHIEKRILSITDYLIDNLQKMKLQILSPLDRDESPDNSNRKQARAFFVVI